MVEAFPWDAAPSYLVRDNDGAYGQTFKDRVRPMGIRDRPISPRSPCQNPYVERLIGTLRRDCLDHVLIFGERHLRRVLTYCIDGFRQSSRPSQLFAPRPLCDGTEPASAGTGVGNPAPLEVGRKSTRTCARSSDG